MSKKVLSYEQEGAALSDPNPQVLSLGSRRGKKVRVCGQEQE
jgi:hypothetical protein